MFGIQVLLLGWVEYAIKRSLVKVDGDHITNRKSRPVTVGSAA